MTNCIYKTFVNGVLTITPMIMHVVLMSVLPMIHYLITEGLIPAHFRLKGVWRIEGQTILIDTGKWATAIIFFFYANFQLKIKTEVRKALEKIYNPIFGQEESSE
jgi:hypothetical protein